MHASLSTPPPDRNAGEAPRPPTHSRRGDAGERGRVSYLADFLRSLPIWAIVVVCCALPLAWMVAQALRNPDTVLGQLWPDAFHRALLARTIGYGLAAATRFVSVHARIPAGVSLIRGQRLPREWNARPPKDTSRLFGSRWLRAKRHAVLAVPSVVLPSEHNFLLDPTHPDFALSGSWYAGAATSGQGMIAEVAPNSSAFFLSWFTYMPNGANAGAAGQRWYTAQGAFTPGLRTIPVQIYETAGGRFDTSTPPGQGTVAVGSGTMIFQSCSAATFNYNFTGGSSNGHSGTIALGRVGPVPPGCIQ